MLLSIPFIVVTLGFFILVANALLFWTAGGLVPGFDVHGFWNAFFGAIIVSVVNWIFSAFIRGESGQTPSLPDADPRSDRFRCGGRGSNFLADRQKKSSVPISQTWPSLKRLRNPTTILPRVIISSPIRLSSTPSVVQVAKNTARYPRYSRVPSLQMERVSVGSVRCSSSSLLIFDADGEGSSAAATE